MIERLQKFAKVLSRIRHILLLLAGACAVLALLSLIDNPWLADDRWLLHSFMGFLWVLMLYTASEVFRAFRRRLRALRTGGSACHTDCGGG